MHLVNGTGNSPSPGRQTPGVVKQDKSFGGSVDTTKTRWGPQRVGMSSGERPIAAAKGKQSDTEASCQPPPRPLKVSRGLSGRHASVGPSSPPAPASQVLIRPNTVFTITQTLYKTSDIGSFYSGVDNIGMSENVGGSKDETVMVRGASLWQLPNCPPSGSSNILFQVCAAPGGRLTEGFKSRCNSGH